MFIISKYQKRSQIQVIFTKKKQINYICMLHSNHKYAIEFSIILPYLLRRYIPQFLHSMGLYVKNCRRIVEKFPFILGILHCFVSLSFTMWFKHPWKGPARRPIFGPKVTRGTMWLDRNGETSANCVTWERRSRKSPLPLKSWESCIVSIDKKCLLLKEAEKISFDTCHALLYFLLYSQVLSMWLTLDNHSPRGKFLGVLTKRA